MMSFTRKRVPLACSFCRSRKRRCDAQKPSCSHCIEMETECHYIEAPSQRIDTTGGTREIMGKLHEIETILKDQTSLILNFPKEAEPSSSEAFMESPVHNTTGAIAAISSNTFTSPSLGFADFQHSSDIQIPPLLIPPEHKTSSSYLLSLPQVKSLVGDYPPDLFFRLESCEPLPLETEWSNPPTPQQPWRIDESYAAKLVDSFFSSAHQHHPLLDESDFRALYSRFIEKEPDSSIDCALCMVVLAIGEAAMAEADISSLKTSPPGMRFIKHAMPTLLYQSSWSFSFDLSLPQALVLSSIYYAYIVRPLRSWRMVYSAATILQLQLSRHASYQRTPRERESIIRLFWSCFLVECDRIAELELPRSGLQQLADTISLPACTDLDIIQSTSFLAEISVRKLLNRIHNLLYQSGKTLPAFSSTTLTVRNDLFPVDNVALQSFCDELHSQLEIWHSSIPDAARPNLDPGSIGIASSDRQTILRIRYFAARHILYRPFLLQIISNPGSLPSGETIDKACICIESCRNYIHSTTPVLVSPSQYTWTFSISSLGAIVVLTLASMSPILQGFVTDIEELQDRAIDNIRPWAFSSLEVVINILDELRRKHNLLSRMQSSVS